MSVCLYRVESRRKGEGAILSNLSLLASAIRGHNSWLYTLSGIFLPFVHSEHIRSPSRQCCVFQFCLDCDNDPEYVVLYCFEIQVVQSYRGKGLGEHLMQNILSLAHFWKMQKLVGFHFLLVLVYDLCTIIITFLH